MNALKLYSVLCLIACNLISLSAQQITEKSDTADYPYWITMMQDHTVNFYSTQSAFNKYWANRDTKVKGKGYKVFKRWEYINETHISPGGKRQEPGYIQKVYDDYMLAAADQKANSSGCSWSLIGPANYPVNQTVQPTGVGRINTIAFHPTDPNTFFAGAASGGIWKTTDGGATWTDISSNMPTLGVSSILIHPSNPDIIYLGSGDRDSDDALGLGVFKSTNGGASWVQINSSMGNATVSAMAMHPSDPNIILAATSTGFYRSTNGGSSWSLRVSGNAWKDVRYKPGDPTIVYAAYGGSFWRSSNGGQSGWASIPLPQTGSRIVIGVTPANPNYVYVTQAKASDGTFAGLMRSSDSGLNFTTQSTTPNIYGYACAGDDNSSQAFYDLCIAVSPTNADEIYVGSINNWKSLDGGVTWAINSHWVGSSFANPCNGAPSVHADQHVLAWSPLNGKLYLGNDGGVYYTNNGGTSWTEISNGLVISQVYKIGQSATTPGLIIHGYQDNGTAVSSSSSFTTVVGGDGFECIIDYSNNNYKFSCNPNGSISRSSGGGYSKIAGNGSNGITESGAFSTPYLQHKTAPATLFAGYLNVWRTTNAKASPASSVTWSAISTGETQTCRVIEQSAADVNIIYVVRSGQVKRTDNANAAPASVTWTTCTLPEGYTPTDLQAHPTLSNVVYATANYGVYKSEDKGLTWTNISTGLPALFSNCVTIDQNSNEGLYIGNQTGIWYKDASMTDWTLCSTGLPPVDIREIEIFYDNANPDNSRLRAATYGKGTWEHPLPSAPPVLNCASLTAVNLTTNSGCTSDTDITTPSATDNCDGNIDGVGTRSDNAVLDASWPLGTTTVTWVFTDNVGSTHQCTQQVIVTDNQPPSVSCPASSTVNPTSTVPCEAVVSGIDATFGDNCAGAALSYQLSGAATGSGSGQASGLSFPVGVTTVTYQANDAVALNSSCSFTITVTALGCPSTTITGNITWENNNAPVKDATVNLDLAPSGAFQSSNLSNSAGNFSLGVASNGNYWVRPVKNINLLNGLTAADATRIQQHITNNPPLVGAYKRIAADVNKSNTITSYDATLITQVLLNNPAALLIFNTSWRFVPASYVFPNPNSPWEFPEKTAVTISGANQTGIDFVGVKLGDVNGTANPQSFGGTEPVLLHTNNATVTEGQAIDLTFDASRFNNTAACQFALQFDPEILALETARPGNLPGLTADNFGLFELQDGIIRFVWSAEKGHTLETGTPLFTLRFRVLRSEEQPLSELLKMADDVLPAIAYSEGLEATGIRLFFEESQVSSTNNTAQSDALLLRQNQPNPFTGITKIGFKLPGACDAQLRVFDISGQLIYTDNTFYQAGNHEKILNLDGNSGILFYELITPFGTRVRKMLLSE